MEKKSPRTPKRKSVAGNVTPNKVQKTGPSPNKNKSPAKNQKNQKGQQKKQLNGRQNTPKPPKPQPTHSEENSEDEELEEQSEDEVILNGSQVEPDSNDSDNEVDEEAESGDEDEDEDNGDDDKEAEKVKTVQKPKLQKNDDFKKYSVFLSGLNYSTKEQDIRNHFRGTKFLSVVFLSHRASKKPNGKAFLNFKDAASVQKALEKDNTVLLGRTIHVNIPFDKSDQDQILERKKRVLAALKRKVELLEQEIQTANSTVKKPKLAKKAVKSN